MQNSRGSLRGFAGKIVGTRVLGFRIISPLLAAYWLLIFTGTHIPHPHVPVPLLSDKVLHFSAYVGLAFLLCWALPALGGRVATKLVLAIATCCIYGIFDELTQSLVRNRHPELLDYVADCLGTATGAATYFLMRKGLSPARLLEQAGPTDCPLQTELGPIEIDQAA